MDILINQFSKCLTNAKDSVLHKIQLANVVYQKSLYDLTNSHRTLEKLQSMIINVDSIIKVMSTMEGSLPIADDSNRGDEEMNEANEANDADEEQPQIRPRPFHELSIDGLSPISSTSLPGSPWSSTSEDYKPNSTLNQTLEGQDTQRFSYLRTISAANELNNDLEQSLLEIRQAQQGLDDQDTTSTFHVDFLQGSPRIKNPFFLPRPIPSQMDEMLPEVEID